jgi:hypothetical protein
MPRSSPELPVPAAKWNHRLTSHGEIIKASYPAISAHIAACTRAHARGEKPRSTHLSHN